MEREVIFSVIALYLLIMFAMLAIHYLQPAGTETQTSSMSPSHSSSRTEDAGDRTSNPDRNSDAVTSGFTKTR